MDNTGFAWELHWWLDFFNIAFFKAEQVMVPVLFFEKIRVNSLGRLEFNRELLGEREVIICINSLYLNRPFWDTLATLLHEMCHGWQAVYGRPSNSWFHNKEFREKMKEVGVVVDSKGYHIGVKDPFVFLLRKHGIVFPALSNADGLIEVPPMPKIKGRSKLKKWQCPCGQAARVGRKRFFATCDLCRAD